MKAPSIVTLLTSLKAALIQFESYMVPMAVVLVGIILVKIIGVFIKRLTASNRDLKYYLPGVDGYIVPFLYLAVLYGAYRITPLEGEVTQVFSYGFKVAFIILATRLITKAFSALVRSYLKNEDATGARFKQARGIVTVINIVLWTLGFIFLLDNLGFNVTAVLTGLGVGGIAIALAAQTILGDLFNYFVIFFDQPFELGDFIIVDDTLGTVESIGLKTTRVRSLQGEQIIFSNSHLTNSKIQNYKRMNERRVVFKIGVVYDTPTEKLEAIPGMIQTIIESQAGTRFDRAHFAEFGAYSLNIEIVYYILSADYNMYMDTQQRINLLMCKKFKGLNIGFAFPTYSIDFGTALNRQTIGTKNGLTERQAQKQN